MGYFSVTICSHWIFAMLTSTYSYKDSKSHFLILDALRGIAAIMVVMMHGFEVFCKAKNLRIKPLSQIAHNLLLYEMYLEKTIHFSDESS